MNFFVQGGPGDGNIMTLLSNGRTKVRVLEITGGSDLAEQFAIIQNTNPEPGTVVVIDENHPGHLKVSDLPYDRKVAGIVSGAGGVDVGLLMKQSGTVADGTIPVSVTGRVFCHADTTGGAIVPGDLLTTSTIPGYAMKVSDYSRAQGAIVGKAMSPLKDGKGLVLVLVALQ